MNGAELPLQEALQQGVRVYEGVLHSSGLFQFYDPPRDPTKEKEYLNCSHLTLGRRV